MMAHDDAPEPVAAETRRRGSPLR